MILPLFTTPVRAEDVYEDDVLVTEGGFYLLIEKVVCSEPDEDGVYLRTRQTYLFDNGDVEVREQVWQYLVAEGREFQVWVVD